MKIKVVLLLFCLLSITAISNGQQLSAQPILRIEIGSHSSKLEEISTDAANRYLVTVSNDKTARVWELSNGKLLSVLRPPIGDDKDGMLYAVSISPDGNTVAVGGWTDSGFGGNHSIYIFDRESGQMKKRIQNLPDVVFNLAYSPDGKYLGATIAGKFGMRLYETNNYRLIGEDTKYDGRSEWIDFNPTSNRLVTSSFDGFLRIYEINNGKLRLLNMQSAKGGEQPIGVKFSPDGAKIAVGFYQTTAVTVVSASDLSFLYAVDVSKVGKGTVANPTYFPVITWSADGRTLFAGGTYFNKKGEFLICSWTNDGRDYRETVASNGAIFDIDALQDGRVVYGVASPPGWGTLDASGQRMNFVSTSIPDFRDNQKGIFVNEDATQVLFPYEPQGRKPAVFTLPDRKLILGENKGLNLKPSLLKSDKLKIVGWNKGQQPILDGSKLSLDRYERSYALSILPNESTFLIGTGWYLRLFNDSGDVLWRVSIPDSAWSLNNSGNGKIAVAALGDGTIRWYRISDGQELLAFFTPNDNTGRWVLWTPSGYYDASSDAEDLIGWHVNNGRDSAADFFPNHLFRAYFYRPDVIDRVLQTADEGFAVKLANKKSGFKDSQLSIAKVLPPVIEVNSSHVKEVSSETAKISYTVRTPSGEPITNIKAFVDGREVKLSDSEKAKTDKDIAEIMVQLPKKDSELTLIAENRFTKSLPAKVQFKWQAK